MSKPVDVARWFPWSPRDFASDPEVLAITRRHGDAGELALRRGFDVAWIEGGLPSSPEDVARLLGGGLEVASEILSALFPIERGDRRWNGRQLSEFEDAVARIEKASKAGRRSAAARAPGSTPVDRELNTSSTGVEPPLNPPSTLVDSGPGPGPGPLDDDDSLNDDSARAARESSSSSKQGKPDRPDKLREILAAWNALGDPFAKARTSKRFATAAGLLDGDRVLRAIAATSGTPFLRGEGRNLGPLTLRELLAPGMVDRVLAGDYAPRARKTPQSGPSDVVVLASPDWTCSFVCALCGGTGALRHYDPPRRCPAATRAE